MLIFRVENVAGEGPYNSGYWDYQDEMGDTHGSDRVNHPTPLAEPELDGIDSDEVCGTVSPESLLAWFDGYWNPLADAGFAVSIFDAENARTSSTTGQAVFLQSTPRLDRVDIQTFLRSLGEA